MLHAGKILLIDVREPSEFESERIAGARAAAGGTVLVYATDLPNLTTAPPPEFDGPGGVWSPEALLVASIVDCLILTFRGVSRAARLEWESLDARGEGTLERIDGVTQFTRFLTRAAVGTEADRRLTPMATRSCGTDRPR